MSAEIQDFVEDVDGAVFVVEVVDVAMETTPCGPVLGDGVVGFEDLFDQAEIFFGDVEVLGVCVGVGLFEEAGDELEGEGRGLFGLAHGGAVDFRFECSVSKR